MPSVYDDEGNTLYRTDDEGARIWSDEALQQAEQDKWQGWINAGIGGIGPNLYSNPYISGGNGIGYADAKEYLEWLYGPGQYRQGDGLTDALMFRPDRGLTPLPGRTPISFNPPDDKTTKLVQSGILAAFAAGLGGAAFGGAGAGAAEGASAGAFGGDFAGTAALGEGGIGAGFGGFGGLDAAWGVNPSGGAFGGDFAGTSSLGEGGIGSGFGGAEGALTGSGGNVFDLTDLQSWAQSNNVLNPDGSVNWNLYDTLDPQGLGNLGATYGASGEGVAAGGLDVGELLKKYGTQNGGSLISRIFGGTATGADWASALGTIGKAGLGIYGANQQQDASAAVADKYLAMGSPYRDKLAASYAPGFSMADQPDFQNALNIGADAAARATSAKVGNPTGNPGAYADMQKYISGSLALPQLNTYRSQLGTFGQLGTNIAGANDTAAAGNEGYKYNALGYGLDQLTQPESPYKGILEGILKRQINTGNGLA